MACLLLSVVIEEKVNKSCNYKYEKVAVCIAERKHNYDSWPTGGFWKL